MHYIWAMLLGLICYNRGYAQRNSIDFSDWKSGICSAKPFIIVNQTKKKITILCSESQTILLVDKEETAELKDISRNQIFSFFYPGKNGINRGFSLAMPDGYDGIVFLPVYRKFLGCFKKLAYCRPCPFIQVTENEYHYDPCYDFSINGRFDHTAMLPINSGTKKVDLARERADTVS